jgi:HK97 family phage major capsid protein
MSGVSKQMEAMNRAFEEYRKAVEAERSLSTQINEEGRAPTPEETEKFERMGEDVSTWKHELDRLIDLNKRSGELDQARGLMEQVISHAPAASQVVHERGIADLFREVRGGASGAHADIELRALQSAGGSAVDQTFYDRVTVFERTLTPMLNPDVVTILNTTRGEPITLPRLTADPNHGGTLTAEAGGINELDATVSSIQLDSYKYAVVNLWSAELDTDNMIGLEDLIARSTARELAIDIGTELTTANGSSKPNGFINAATNGGTAAGTANNTFFGPDDLIDLFYGRAQPYRVVGTWQASSTGLAKVRKLQDANGQKIWEPSLVPGAPEMVLGRPIFENPAMAAVASASKSIAFGDFSRYFVRRVTPARVELSRDYKFSTDQLALKTVERVDGDLVDTVAIAYLVSANA